MADMDMDIAMPNEGGGGGGGLVGALIGAADPGWRTRKFLERQKKLQEQVNEQSRRFFEDMTAPILSRMEASEKLRIKLINDNRPVVHRINEALMAKEYAELAATRHNVLGMLEERRDRQTDLETYYNRGQAAFQDFKAKMLRRDELFKRSSLLIHQGVSSFPSVLRADPRLRAEYEDVLKFLGIPVTEGGTTASATPPSPAYALGATARMIPGMMVDQTARAILGLSGLPEWQEKSPVAMAKAVSSADPPLAQAVANSIDVAKADRFMLSMIERIAPSMMGGQRGELLREMLLPSPGKPGEKTGFEEKLAALGPEVSESLAFDLMALSKHLALRSKPIDASENLIGVQAAGIKPEEILSDSELGDSKMKDALKLFNAKVTQELGPEAQKLYSVMGYLSNRAGQMSIGLMRPSEDRIRSNTIESMEFQLGMLGTAAQGAFGKARSALSQVRSAGDALAMLEARSVVSGLAAGISPEEVTRDITQVLEIQTPKMGPLFAQHLATYTNAAVREFTNKDPKQAEVLASKGFTPDFFKNLFGQVQRSGAEDFLDESSRLVGDLSQRYSAGEIGAEDFKKALLTESGKLRDVTGRAETFGEAAQQEYGDEAGTQIGSLADSWVTRVTKFPGGGPLLNPLDRLLLQPTDPRAAAASNDLKNLDKLAGDLNPTPTPETGPVKQPAELDAMDKAEQGLDASVQEQTDTQTGAMLSAPPMKIELPKLDVRQDDLPNGKLGGSYAARIQESQDRVKKYENDLMNSWQQGGTMTAPTPPQSAPMIGQMGGQGQKKQPGIQPMKGMA